MATNSEIRAGGRLAGDALADAVRSVRHIHMAIAQRAFDAVGPAGVPARLAHNRIADDVYWLVGGAHSLAPRAGAVATAAYRRRAEHQAPSEKWSESRRAAPVLAALNGLRGDAMTERYPELALTMTLREHSTHTDVVLDAAGISAAYPHATSRLAVFVHGLCETEQSWWHGAAAHHGDAATSFGTLLRDDFGYTPLYVRYNTGLRVSDNGGSLVDLIDRVVSAWPVTVDEIVFVGHSMGGLVVRSACHRADIGGRPWAGLIRHVFCLGTPHLGSPIERGVNTTARLLARIPEARPLAVFLDKRSVGVKDLGHGLIADDDWHGDDPRAFLRERRAEVPFLASAAYYFIGATVTRDRLHPLGHMIGDLLVRYTSAAGAGRHRSIPFELGNGAHLGGLHHFDLLNHPAVYDQLRQWLSRVGDPVRQ